jgi:hypothetical protein
MIPGAVSKTPSRSGLDSFRCSAFYPALVDNGALGKIVVCIHLDRVAREVAREAASRLNLPAPELLAAASAIASVRLPRHATVEITHDLPGLVFDSEKLAISVWEDKQFAEFRFKADSSDSGAYRCGWLRFWLEGVALADLQISVVVRQNQFPIAFREVMESRSAAPYRLVFPSYSHQDKAVVDRLEAYAEAFGDEYLRDVKRLRTGQKWSEELRRFVERANVFQLFWSERAAKSKYVTDEWRYALEVSQNDRSRANFVRPVYWTESLVPDPPDELRPVHFAKVSLLAQ